MASTQKHQDINRFSEPFVRNAPVVFTIPLGGYINEMRLALRGAITVVGANAAANPYGEGIIEMLKKITVTLVKKDGSFYPDGDIRTVTPRMVLRRRIFDKGKFVGDLKGTTVVDVAATYNIYEELVIRFALPYLKRPMDSALNLNEYKSAIVTVDCGDEFAAFPGTANAFNLSGVYLDYSDRREDMSGDTFVVFENDFQVQINGANQRLEVKNFPAGGNFYDVLLITESGATRTLVDTILNKLDISIGSTFRLKKNALDIKGTNFEYGADASQTCTGVYYLPISPDGLLLGAAPVATETDITNEFDVANPGGAGADWLRFSVRRVYFPQNFKPAAAIKGQASKRAA